MSFVITIARQYGSGGREVGEKLAQSLGIEFYDKKIVEMACEKENIHIDIADKEEEKATNSLLYTIVTDGIRGIRDMGTIHMPLNDRLFVAESEVIKEVAQKDCVIVGRAADYVLSDTDTKVFSVFVYASLPDRIQRIMRLYGLTEKQAKDKIASVEKTRKNFYNYYTDRRWGEMTNYDLCVNTSFGGVDKAVEMLKNYISKELDR